MRNMLDIKISSLMLNLDCNKYKLEIFGSVMELTLRCVWYLSLTSRPTLVRPLKIFLCCSIQFEKFIFLSSLTIYISFSY